MPTIFLNTRALVAPIVALILAMTFVGGSSPLLAQSTSNGQKVEVKLVSDVRSVVPGATFKVGLLQAITKGWHTYWRNPGDSGQQTRITWDLPNGFSASDIGWPIPEAIPYGPLVNFGYHDEVLLPVEITAPMNLESRTVTLRGKAEWLVCENVCIPESADISITMPVAPPGAESLPGRYADKFAEVARAIPSASPWPVSALVGKKYIALKMDAPGLARDKIQGMTFFPFKTGIVEHAERQPVLWATGGPQLTIARTDMDLNPEELDPFQGVLVLTETINGATVRSGFTVSAKTSVAAASDFEDIGQPVGAGSSSLGLSLWQAILFALIGGAILNLMPCVLPILSLKVMALARHTDDDDFGAQAKASGLWYLAGVMASFAALAVFLIALKSAGAALGWGFQFQSPLFVLAMAGLFFLLGLSLSGVFDIGSALQGSGASLANQGGARGSFFTGALATIAATPCTAPFMGAAVGFALSRSNVELFFVLMALGAGFALPMVALSYSGAAAKILPKPGPWMETLKQALAFPLYATVAWLVWVLSVQTGSAGVLGAAIVLVALAFSAWLVGKVGLSFSLRAAVAALVAIVAIAVAAPMMETVTKPVVGRDTISGVSGVSGVKAENVFSKTRLGELRAQGRPVFVNFTAAWCITCKVNEQIALGTKVFRDAMAKKNVAYLKGDWTSQDAEITSVLTSFGRSGVPLYLLYPADKDAKPIVLPQLLTHGIVLGHLDALADPAANSASSGGDH